MKKVSALISIISFIAVIVLAIIKIVTNEPSDTIFAIVIWALAALCMLTGFSVIKGEKYEAK